MARTKNKSRDKLIQSFLARNPPGSSRRTSSGGIRTGFPRPGQGQNATFTRARTDPPRQLVHKRTKLKFSYAPDGFPIPNDQPEDFFQGPRNKRKLAKTRIGYRPAKRTPRY